MKCGPFESQTINFMAHTPVTNESASVHETETISISDPRQYDSQFAEARKK